MTKPIVDFNNFSFYYDKKHRFGLKNINLKINKGEMIVITGPSGCGKTSIIRCIDGLIPDFYDGDIEGDCIVKDMNIKEHETSDYAPFVGTVFQDPRTQFFTLHVKTELPFPSENLAIPREKIQRSVSETVKELNLDSLINKSIFKLSSGEKQKIAIASICIAGVEIILLDEPSANLDTEATVQLKKLLIELKRLGKTIIVSEHKLYYLKDIFDRMIIMNEGSIVKEVNNDELGNLSDLNTDKYRLRSMDLASLNKTTEADNNCFARDKKIGSNEDNNKLIIRDREIKTTPKDNLIEAENISFKYPNSEYLFKDVSFKADSGEIIGIIGRNGAGKSTLIRILMGLEKPKNGSISFNGRKVSKKERIKKSFYAMQDVDYQFFEGSVIREMMANIKNDDKNIKRAEDILKDFNLYEYRDEHPSNLSGGQKQRLSIALSLMNDKPYLYFDEPTSGLDLSNMQIIRNLIKKQAENGSIAFVITHDYEFALSLFTSLIIINDDKTITRVTKEEFNDELLLNLFDVEEEL